jgi:hypothetical protein
MSTSVEEYKTIGLTLINTAERYVDTEPIQNELAAIGKTETSLEHPSTVSEPLLR